MPVVTAGTIANIIVAIMAVGALALSIISLVLQRKDVARQDERWEQQAQDEDERWQQQEERWKEEKERRKREQQPSLELTSDSRLLSVEGEIISTTHRIYSCRVVNDGHIPVEIRRLRMFTENGQTLPMPSVTDKIQAHFWENEKPANGFTPFSLAPHQSVRFATMQSEMEDTLRKAGLSGFVDGTCVTPVDR